MWNIAVHRAIIHWAILSASRRNRITSMKLTRASRGRNGRPAMVYRGQQLAILSCAMFVVHLHPRGFKVAFVLPAHLIMVRACHDSTTSTVVAHACDVHIVDDGFIVDMNIGDVDVGYGAVVEVVAAFPISAEEAHAGIAKAVVNPAVETDVRSPVSGMPDVKARAPTPITRRPEQSRLRRRHPSSRHPVVAIRPVSPIARGPNVAISWAGGLDVNRQHWRRDGYLYKNAGEC